MEMKFIVILGVGTDSGEGSSKVQVGISDTHKLDGKNQQEVIHGHTRYKLMRRSSWYLVLQLVKGNFYLLHVVNNF